jgi:predicted protein tyrosine phosphatase
MTSGSGFVQFSITVCGIAELDAHCAVSVSHVLSILDPGDPPPPALGTFGEHERLDLRFHDIIDPQPGMRLAGPADIDALLAFGADLSAETGAHLLVHCHQGVSRSTAAMTLILAQARPDQPAEAALAEVARIRRRAWPNLRIIELGDARLGRGGALVAAARRRYGEMIRARPEIADAMRRGGRMREIEAAVFSAEG